MSLLPAVHELRAQTRAAMRSAAAAAICSCLLAMLLLSLGSEARFPSPALALFAMPDAFKQMNASIAVHSQQTVCCCCCVTGMLLPAINASCMPHGGTITVPLPLQALFGDKVEHNVLRCFSTSQLEGMLRSQPAAVALAWLVRGIYLLAGLATLLLQASHVVRGKGHRVYALVCLPVQHGLADSGAIVCTAGLLTLHSP